MTSNIKSFRDLEVWKKSMDLVVESYRLTRRFPKHETYGLCSQMQRAVTSVPANIAEGHGRDHLRDYLRHLSFAKGSLTELETHVLIAERLTYVSTMEIRETLQRIDEVGRMLSGLSRSLSAKLKP